MFENTNSNHIIKTPFEFQLNKLDKTCSQTQPVNNEFNLVSCFANFFKTFTMKQADIMSKFVSVVSEKHAENVNKISSEIGKRFDKF